MPVDMKTKSRKIKEFLTLTVLFPSVCRAYLGKPFPTQNVGSCQRGTIGTLIRSKVCPGIVTAHARTHADAQSDTSTSSFYFFSFLCFVMEIVQLQA